MACKNCHWDSQSSFHSEIAVHFPGGLDALEKEQVLIFPQLLVCLNCGFTEFLFPEADLRRLAAGTQSKPTVDSQEKA
jgi:hypothetical protein